MMHGILDVKKKLCKVKCLKDDRVMGIGRVSGGIRIDIGIPMTQLPVDSDVIRRAY